MHYGQVEEVQSYILVPRPPPVIYTMSRLKLNGVMPVLVVIITIPFSFNRRCSCELLMCHPDLFVIELCIAELSFVNELAESLLMTPLQDLSLNCAVRGKFKSCALYTYAFSLFCGTLCWKYSANCWQLMNLHGLQSNKVAHLQCSMIAATCM